MKKFAIALSLFSYILGLSIVLATASSTLTHNAFGCSCAGNVTIEELIAGSDAIFTGKVLVVTPTTSINNDAVFLVDKSWKGVNEKIVVVSTASQGTMCGAGFETGHEYLVYASENNGGLNTGRCGGAQSISYAVDDIQKLGNGQVPIQYPIRVDGSSAPLIGFSAAIAGIVVFFTLRKRNR